MPSSVRAHVKTAVATIDRFALATGKLIAWLVLAMMVLTCWIVVLRYGFSMGSIALQESLTYLHATVFLLGIAYTLKQDGHVRVDIFYRRLGSHQQAWINALGSLMFLLPVCLFILFISWDFVLNAWAVKESSASSGGIPAVFLLKSLIPLAAFLIALQGVGEVLRSLLLLTSAADKPTDSETQEAPHAN
ncbi:TRAP transporter small permease subunit [Pseudomaricurvus sp.]|uniref:TRAP transporter small permease subunit n=1 Tax=Pseudomaricurvus sp. TaxID=2004510 RepID=UPI003F6C0C97